MFGVLLHVILKIVNIRCDEIVDADADAKTNDDAKPRDNESKTNFNLKK